MSSTTVCSLDFVKSMCVASRVRVEKQVVCVVCVCGTPEWRKNTQWGRWESPGLNECFTFWGNGSAFINLMTFYWIIPHPIKILKPSGTTRARVHAEKR